jgi:LacI family transcriptional regulator
VDGIIFFLISMHLERWGQLLPLVEDIGVPYVVVQSSTRDVGGPCITLDSYKVGYLAAEHLAGHGYKNFGCITHPRQWAHFADQLAGYKQGLQDKGLALDPSHILNFETVSFNGGYRVAGKILADPVLRKVRAWFVADEVNALGVIKKFREAGHRVPEDAAIVSFGDTNPEGMELTELTTISQLSAEKGMQAGEMLLGIIDRKKKPAQQLKKLEPSLLISKSCGCGQ